MLQREDVEEGKRNGLRAEPCRLSVNLARAELGWGKPSWSEFEDEGSEIEDGEQRQLAQGVFLQRRTRGSDDS